MNNTTIKDHERVRPFLPQWDVTVFVEPPNIHGIRFTRRYAYNAVIEATGETCNQALGRAIARVEQWEAKKARELAYYAWNAALEDAPHLAEKYEQEYREAGQLEQAAKRRCEKLYCEEN